MKIYVASSWRNDLQPTVVQRLEREGHDVYDFRHPAPGNNGFHWSAIDEAWRDWSPQAFRAALDHPVAREGYGHDIGALEAAEATVLVLPSGRSAHLEAGFAAGSGQRVFVLALEQTEPELMYLMCEKICCSVDELVDALKCATCLQAQGRAEEEWECCRCGAILDEEGFCPDCEQVQRDEDYDEHRDRDEP